ncbi:MAG: hypothetical protein EZS28_038627, partial [Streblomastix strix]
GTLDHFSTYTKGNQWYHQRFRISAIVDMTAVPRKVVFYVDGIEQPDSVVEIPSEIRFWVYTWQRSSTFKVTKFEKLIKFTSQAVAESKTLKWGKEWK